MNLFKEISSIENLYESWKEFSPGKRRKPDVQQFERHLERNLFALQDQLRTERYRHGPYRAFSITDPKLRRIHKATVRDRIVHHAIYRVLYPLFDRSFIFDSYSCRLKKGTHQAIERLEQFTRCVSRNFTQPCITLKADIRRFFASIDHGILTNLLKQHINDPRTLWLLNTVIESFDSRERERE